MKSHLEFEEILKNYIDTIGTVLEISRMLYIGFGYTCLRTTDDSIRRARTAPKVEDAV